MIESIKAFPRLRSLALLLLLGLVPLLQGCFPMAVGGAGAGAGGAAHPPPRAPPPPGPGPHGACAQAGREGRKTVAVHNPAGGWAHHLKAPPQAVFPLAARVRALARGGAAGTDPA